MFLFAVVVVLSLKTLIELALVESTLASAIKLIPLDPLLWCRCWLASESLLFPRQSMKKNCFQALSGRSVVVTSCQVRKSIRRLGIEQVSWTRVSYQSLTESARGVSMLSGFDSSTYASMVLCRATQINSNRQDVKVMPWTLWLILRSRGRRDQSNKSQAARCQPLADLQPTNWLKWKLVRWCRDYVTNQENQRLSLGWSRNGQLQGVHLIS